MAENTDPRGYNNSIGSCFAEEAKINFALLRKRSLALAKQVQVNLNASSALLGMADSNLLAAIEQRVQQRCQWLEERLGA
ncbi:hypothetical protein [Thiothrix eikelboomii]|uniref:hypothetical protein n=1 Tax=Thiothrix eikelboomii TaxID=92487 RepID=UPI003BB0455E